MSRQAISAISLLKLFKAFNFDVSANSIMSDELPAFIIWTSAIGWEIDVQLLMPHP